MAIKRIIGQDGLPYLISSLDESGDEQYSDWAAPDLPSSSPGFDTSTLFPESYPGQPSNQDHMQTSTTPTSIKTRVYTPGCQGEAATSSHLRHTAATKNKCQARHQSKVCYCVPWRRMIWINGRAIPWVNRRAIIHLLNLQSKMQCP
ncbi:MAG: hypothetical protein V4495_27490 [Pseudomonadota bacterium]